MIRRWRVRDRLFSDQAAMPNNRQKTQDFQQLSGACAAQKPSARLACATFGQNFARSAALPPPFPPAAAL
ncbi:hypothetical protein [Azospirillum sp. BE72]|uniref:hypothetical protein n=1 Tax=Azospirillum sp. BE72 TaxID=2817776 RepID=UPI0028626DEB|nr:hypothetical protein [Azospirillum sp. BE72]MDR6772302.1 hypothetical protein [Azospirillum sp. BE72]